MKLIDPKSRAVIGVVLLFVPKLFGALNVAVPAIVDIVIQVIGAAIGTTGVRGWFKQGQ